MASARPESELPICPFCGFESPDSYTLMHHVEISHPEGGYSPFITTGNASGDIGPFQQGRQSRVLHSEEGDWALALVTEDEMSDIEDDYVECPTGCGEQIRYADVSIHLDFHFAESAVLEDTGCEELAKEHVDKKWTDYVADTQDQVSKKVAQKLDTRDFTLSSKSRRKDNYRGASRAPATSRHQNKDAKVSKGAMHTAASRRSRRFSKTDLGPYAHEKAMPSWLRKKLEDEPSITRVNEIQPDGSIAKVETIANQTPGLIPVLSHLSRQDREVERTFLCHPMTRHVFKMGGEGGFCGYRNIQMLVSYIQEARASGHDKFPGRMPTVLALQDMIERAWDMGYNSASRNDVGHIKNTRKYIGTSEAQALFLSLNIGCTPAAFADANGTRGYRQLLESVLNYFLQGQTSCESGTIVQTTLPPIYLQHSGHSLTVVGLEARRDGSLCLLVFDPGFTQSPSAERIGKRTAYSNPGRILKAYRRGEEYLRRYREYEILKLTPTQFPPQALGDESRAPAYPPLS